MDREASILEHLPQVRWIAYKIHRRLPLNSVSLEDLVDAGVIGLIAAVDGFDSTRGLLLKTYAEHKIRGAIVDSLRKLDFVSRGHRTRRKSVEAVIALLENQLQRAPTEEEIAVRLDMPLGKYREWLRDNPVVTIGSLEYDGFTQLSYIADPSESVGKLIERDELEAALADAIKKLPPRERTIVSLYFYNGLSIREIGKVMNVHESRISQLKSQAILRLRTHLRKSWPAERDAEAA